MLRALKVELRKIFSQRGTYAGFLVLAGLIGLVVYGIWRRAPGEHALGHIESEGLIVAGNATTAPFVVQLILVAVIQILLPLLIAMVVGGLVANEIKAGTMRTLLLRPISRMQLLVAKFVAAWIYTIALCLFVLLTAAALAYAVFEGGDMISIEADGLVIFSHVEALGRLALAYAWAAAGRCVVATIAVMFSCLFDNGLTAAGLTVAVLIVFSALENIPYFDTWEPYFLTWQLHLYQLALQADIDWLLAARKALGLGVYSAVAFAVSAVAFLRRDIP